MSVLKPLLDILNPPVKPKKKKGGKK